MNESTLKGFKAGDSFDPIDAARRLKTYPRDVVDADPNISDGPKRLYSKLFQIAVTADRRKTPWSGFVYASEAYLSSLLGKSTSGIRRDAATLRALGLIRVERPSQRGNNQYFFLWKSNFDSANVSGQAVEQLPDESANMRGQNSDERSDMSAHIRHDSAYLGGRDSANVSGLYKEEPIIETHREELAERSGLRSLEFPRPDRFREIKIPLPASSAKQEPRGYAFDEQFAEFCKCCREWGMNLVEPEDFYDAYRFEWLPKDPRQRQAVIDALRERIAAGIDPLGWKPKNFLKSEWRRPIKALRPTSDIDYRRAPDAETFYREEMAR